VVGFVVASLIETAVRAIKVRLERAQRVGHLDRTLHEGHIVLTLLLIATGIHLGLMGALVTEAWRQ
jgi:hypothetical protein